MRIVGGALKGRRIAAPAGRDVRPTSDRARESLFNVLAHGIDWPGFEGAVAVDLFAGSGALGLEALSRGARHATFVDNAAPALKAVRRNAAEMGVWRQTLLLDLDATRLPPPPRAAHCPADLVFLDPPYGAGLAAPALIGLAAKGWIGAGGIAVVEFSAKETFEPPKGYDAVDARAYDAARVQFLKVS